MISGNKRASTNASNRSHLLQFRFVEWAGELAAISDKVFGHVSFGYVLESYSKQPRTVRGFLSRYATAAQWLEFATLAALHTLFRAKPSEQQRSFFNMINWTAPGSVDGPYFHEPF